MPIFVHLAPASQIKHIRKVGIKRSNGYVFCMPVVPVFYVSHQWVHELRRWKPGPMMAVYFSLPDDEQVWVGHYSKRHRQRGANEATKEIMDSPDAQGFEVIVERAIEPSEIRKIRAIPQVTGWRYMPGQHQRPPCFCPSCSRGDVNVQRQRRYGERLKKRAIAQAGASVQSSQAGYPSS
jgi:hypothetical protein